MLAAGILADLAWNEVRPSGVPLTVRRDALRMAGYRFQDHPAHQPAAAPRTPISLAQQRARTRAILAYRSVPPLARPLRIEVLEPGTDPETDYLCALERADYDGGGAER